MLALVPWVIFIHILGLITFFLAHGTSIAMAFQLRRETDFARIRALPDLSMSTMVVMFVSFVVMEISGLIMPFIMKLWNRGWIWASIVLQDSWFALYAPWRPVSCGRIGQSGRSRRAD